MFIHINRLSWFPGLDKLFFRLFVSFFIFQEKCIFQVNITNFMFCVLFCHSESLIKLISIRQIFNHGINQIHLQQHFHPLLWTQCLCPLFSQFASFFIRTIKFATSDSIFPQIMRFIHFDTSMPMPCFDVMLFTHFVITLSFQSLCN